MTNDVGDDTLILFSYEVTHCLLILLNFFLTNFKHTTDDETIRSITTIWSKLNKPGPFWRKYCAMLF